jgi:YesN/AraC family two-component response regulator
MFVDDEPNVLNGLKRFCRSKRHVWDMQFVEGGEAALELLSNQAVDVVVSDMRMPGINGADLFEQISQRWPGIVRIMLSGEAEPGETMRTVGRSHRFLAKPCDPNALIQAIEAPLAMTEALGLQDQTYQNSYLECLQTSPEVFKQLHNLLEKEDVSEKQVAALVKGDAALSARILQLANSAYFGRPVLTCNIAKSIETIGLNRIRKLLALQRLGNHESTIGTALNEAPVQAMQQYAACCDQCFAQKHLPEGQQDLIFTAGLLSMLEQIGSGKIETKNMAAVPAYIVSLLGLPPELSDIMVQMVGNIPIEADPSHRLELVLSIVQPSNSHAA